MLTSKKYTREEIIRAICEEFGSIENYAKQRKTTPQNIYQKTLYQTSKFMNQLKTDGVVIGGNILRNKSGDNIISNNDVDLMRKYISALERIRELEEKIRRLEKKYVT